MTHGEPAPGKPAAEIDRHGPLARAALVIVGTIFALAGVAVLVALVPPALPGRESLHPPPLSVVVAASALFTGIAVYGCTLVARGVRGRSRRRFARAQHRMETWYRRHWWPVLLVVFGVLAAAGLAVAGPEALLLDPDASGLRLAWFAFLALALLPAHVALHELGHAAAGALLRFRFAAIRVGNLVLRREAGRFRLGWSRMSADVLGMAHAVPEGEGALRLRLALRALCGPATTLLAAAACRAGALALGPPPIPLAAVASHALYAGYWTGAFLGIVNLLPLRFRSGFSSDGAHVLGALLATSPAAKASLRWSILSARGCRPREWGMSVESLLAAANGDRRHRDALLVAALGVALDTGDAARADEILRRAAEAPPSASHVRHEIELQAAMVEAFRGDPARARERLSRLGPHGMLRDYPKLAEAVLFLAEGRPAEARSSLDAWERAIAATGMGPALRVGNEWAEEALRPRLGGEGLAPPAGTAVR